ncbi:hypothetical protein Pmani_037360 [Petrolisthes manimaculis]|uniref:Gag-like protein n=1 Tax=Petrolisthes manimaculis TaxID=1843537 RepID=A0AAE1NHX3_9EUCA|nr:hypothetical protein Pmani_037360 [Petrolisthes manimaculis]
MKLVFPDETTSNKAMVELESTELSGTHTVKSEAKIKPKISLTYVPDEIDDSDIMELIKEKSNDKTPWVDKGETMRILFSKKSLDDCKTVILAVTPKLCSVIKNQNDPIYIQFSRCRVFDHDWANRCGHCMRFLHKTQQCRYFKPTCGYCGDDRLTKNCIKRDNPKCANCLSNSKEDTGHPAFSKNCPRL